MDDISQLNKYTKLGNALVEIQAERERQIARAPPGPSNFAGIVTKHYQGKDEEAVMAQVRVNAIKRANPNPKKVPVTEMEKLIADAPKTSAQVIGTHKVPSDVWLDKGPPKKLTQLQQMYKIYPQTTSAEAGFHYNFEQANTREAKDAAALMDTLSVKQVKHDPQLAAALTKIKSRAQYVGRMHDHSGAQRGVQTRKQ